METYQEGTIAVNPSTGEKLVFSSGQWIPAPQPPSTGQRVYNAIQNVPGSALELGKSYASAIMHPLDTASNVADVLKGYMQKGRELSPPEYRGTAPAFDKTKAEAVNEMFRQRYGGAENIAQTAEKDPVGMAVDLAAVLTGGGSLLGKVPGVVGKAGQVVAATGRAIEPVNVAGKVLSTTFGTIPRETLGFTTGAGEKSIGEAFASGVAGGEKGAAFRENISGQAKATDVVDEARAALDKMRTDRSTAYKSGMVDIKADPTVLDMSPIVKKVEEVRNRGTYKGKVIDKSAADTWQQIDDVVNDWEKSNPTDFHTPEGLDALKKRIGDIRDSLPYGTPARNAATNVFNVVREQIVNQAPAYGKVMKDYNEASDTLQELEKALSLKEKASADTALRKLQSIMRNNVQTNYGRRAELGDLLVQQGADTLYPALAGQALSSLMPRSISGQGSAFSGAGAALASGHPYALAGLAATSPRIVGEGAYYLGRGASIPVKLADILQQYSGAAGRNPMVAKQLALQLGRMQQAAQQEQE